MKKAVVQLFACFVALVMLFSCKEKETCSDAVKNQKETGIDCGGSCKPCDICADGLLNGDELATDCGGAKCRPCGNEDGIMNNDETGVDCGGVNCEPCNPSQCNIAPAAVENGYLPNGHDSLVSVSAGINPSAETGDDYFGVASNYKSAGWQYPDAPSKGFRIVFYGGAILKMPVNTTQVFKTLSLKEVDELSASNPQKVSNKCVLYMKMAFGELQVKNGEAVYVTKIADKKYNLKICHVPFPQTSTYSQITNFSTQTSFTLIL